MVSTRPNYYYTDCFVPCTPAIVYLKFICKERLQLHDFIKNKRYKDIHVPSAYKKYF